MLIPFKFKVDVVESIHNLAPASPIHIVDKTIDELDSIIKNQKGQDKDAAKFAISYIQKKDIQITKTTAKDSFVDNIIIDIAKNKKIIVATQDLNLKKKIKNLGSQVIFLRQKKYLEIN